MPVSTDFARRLASLVLCALLGVAPLAAGSPAVSPAASPAGPPAALPAALPAASPAAPRGRPLGRPAEESPALARAGGEVLRQAEFEAALRKAPGRYATPAERRALLEEMLRFRLLVARAKALGYDRDPEIVALVERTLVAKLLREELGEGPAPPPGEAEIAAFYAGHQAEFTRPERSEIALVQLAAPAGGDPALRQAAAARAAEALAAARKLPAGTLHFGAVAARYSDHRESRAFGGRYGWLEAGAPSRLPAPVLAAAAKLEPGEIAPLVAAEDGVYLLRLMRREPARPLPLATVRDGIAARLAREANEARRARFENELMAGAAIDVDEALLAAVAAPPGLPSSPIPAPPPLPALPELSRSNSAPGEIP